MTLYDALILYSHLRDKLPAAVLQSATSRKGDRDDDSQLFRESE
jgi:hypothetical protein